MSGEEASFVPFKDQPDLHTPAPYRAAQLTYPANLRQALKDAQADKSKTLLGVAQGIPNVFVTKILASTKPDFIWIDVQHGIFDRLTLFDAVHAAQAHSEGKAAVVVRVPKHDEVSLITALDAGASGIVIPDVESAQDVKDFIQKIYYAPIGKRSFSPWIFTPGVSDASLYPNDQFNIATSNRHVCVIPQVETVRGIENVDEIAAVPGIHGLMFGPGDYMISAGLPLKLGGEPHPTFVAAMTKLVTAAKTNGLALFGAAQSPDMVPVLIQQGYAGIAVAFDYWGLASMVKDALNKGGEFVKQAAGTETP
ncbi:hypothetical protein DPSP01_012523 [Paraphaeosphaeria sporulosa]|uniref:Macrophomate synthase n=1 Tax=Paraphaeosphaeria sporulosa TaxID=1460663 RepID=A0A177BVN2_9PLEO|nr:Macrophomate synthase [Paraphaeosphaeria sporulosa]OAF99374.1 Macrophomate synthase [Paraphaeosphaeria sporulosa]